LLTDRSSLLSILAEKRRYGRLLWKHLAL